MRGNESGRIYFDNAATSFPKPESVHEAMSDYALRVGASAGRGAYQEAIESGELIDQTRQLIAQLLNVSDRRHLIMTFNCTDGLSLAIKGLLTEPGGHVITTRMDHNSVLRPLHSLREQLGISISFVGADGVGLIDPEDIRRAIRPETRLIAVVHGSNVCGSIQDIDAVGHIAREYEIPFLVDAAQTAGHVPIDVQKSPIDLLAFPGHKGLLGPLGTGVLYIRPGLEGRLRPLREGGTGSRSELPIQPDFMPDRFEAGSHNAIGIAGLNAGVRFLLDQGIDTIRRHERESFLECTGEIEGLTVYGPRDLAKRIGVFSVRLEGFEVGLLAEVLEKQFGQIAVGDIILLKESGGPVRARAVARKIWFFENLNADRVNNIRKRFNHRILADDSFWNSKENSRYATLISLKTIKKFNPPYRIKTPGFKAWLIGKPEKIPPP